LNSSFESTPSWFVSRLSKVGAAAVDDVEGAGGFDGVDGVDDCCASVDAGMANKKRRGVRQFGFISVLLTRDKERPWSHAGAPRMTLRPNGTRRTLG
jgi:hypothetical protein